MITALALVGLAFLVAGPVSSSLARCAWTRRYPRTGVAAWFAAAIVILASLVGAGLSLTSSNATCTVGGAMGSLMASLSGPRPLAHLDFVGAVGLSIAFNVLVASLVIVLLTALRLRQERAQHRRILTVVGERVEERTVLVPYSEPLAYFVPGHGGRIVMSTGMTELFGRDEIAAVLAHEEGHRRGHHSSLVLPFHSLGVHFRWLPFARHASSCVAELIEFVADDRAILASGRQSLLRALLAMVGVDAAAPSCALGVGGGTLGIRIERLTSHTPVRCVQLTSQLSALGAAAFLAGVLWCG